MRLLDEAETTVDFKKLFKFTSKNLKHIVENPSHEGSDSNPGRYCFCLHKNRIYYVSESLSKFTHRSKFYFTIQALSVVATDARHKVRIKPTSEMSFLYGNHVLKGGLGRITDSIAPGDGVVVFSMSGVALGFGVVAKSTHDCRKLDPNGIVVLHQSDIGEYLRMEDEL